jgi:hypothetical protein
MIGSVSVGLKYTAGICSVALCGVSFQAFWRLQDTQMVPDKSLVMNEKRKKLFSLW